MGKYEKMKLDKNGYPIVADNELVKAYLEKNPSWIFTSS